MRMVQVGLGSWGRSWAGVVRDAESVELGAVVDKSPEARAFAEGELGLASGNVYGTLTEALSGTDCDAVLVVTPPATHNSVTMEALQAGKNVLCEKPLDTTIDGASALTEAAKGADRVLMVSQNYHFNASFRAAQRAVRDGSLGALLSVKVSCRRDVRALFPPDDFRYRMRHPYAMDMAIHHLDMLRAMTGRDVRWILARSWRAPDSPFEHHPEVAAVIELHDGTPVIYEGTWAARDPETSWNGDWELVGEKGRMIWADPADEDRNAGGVVLEPWGEPPRPVEQPRLALTERAAVLQAFRAAVHNGTEPETAASDNIRSLAATLGLVESVESGAPVDVESQVSGGEQRG